LLAALTTAWLRFSDVGPAPPVYLSFLRGFAECPAVRIMTPRRSAAGCI
jgi:hypothetical protein